jgi:hypothetical protein
VHSARRPRRGPTGRAKRTLEARQPHEGSQGSAPGNSRPFARGRQLSERQDGTDLPLFVEDHDIFGRDADVPARPLTEAERKELAAFEARQHEREERRDRTYRLLMLDAQACARSMFHSPQLDSLEEWEATVSKSLADYHSGRALMDQLGADRLLDAPTAGMLLAIRRGLIDETNATSASELVLIDMAVIAFANAMRVQSMIGNTALLIETEMFGQPTLRAKWKKEHGGRPNDIQGLAVEEHVLQLRDKLLPLVEKFHRIARESIETISRMRQVPAMAVERAEPVNIVLVAPGSI